MCCSFLTINSVLSASTKTINDSYRTQLSALTLTFSKCFATCSSVIDTLKNTRFGAVRVCRNFVYGWGLNSRERCDIVDFGRNDRSQDKKMFFTASFFTRNAYRIC